ncbi:MAG: hypothetical protein K2Q24_02570 [Chitinophagaceae bacterium]|nr:hypothetical protein [Chitinophagaceae bacterium]
MEQPGFSAANSLQLIESMINKAQNRFNENGHLYLLWGWVIFICSVVHFVVDYWNIYDRPQFVWFATWAGLIYQMIYLARTKKKEWVKTYTDEIIGHVWIVFVIMMALAGFIAGKSEAWPLMYPLFLVLYGMPTFLSGAIIKFSPLKAGAVGCWVLAIASAFVPAHYQVLFLALAVLSAWIIPGYLLCSQFKKQN